MQRTQNSKKKLKKLEDVYFLNTKHMVQTIIIKISQTHRIRGWWLLGADRRGKCGSNGQRVQNFNYVRRKINKFWKPAPQHRTNG